MNRMLTLAMLMIVMSFGCSAAEGGDAKNGAVEVGQNVAMIKNIPLGYVVEKDAAAPKDDAMVIKTSADYGVLVDCDGIWIKDPETGNLVDIKPTIYSNGKLIKDGKLKIRVCCPNSNATPVSILATKCDAAAVDIKISNEPQLQEMKTEAGNPYQMVNKNGETFIVVPKGTDPNDPKFWSKSETKCQKCERSDWKVVTTTTECKSGNCHKQSCMHIVGTDDWINQRTGEVIHGNN